MIGLWIILGILLVGAQGVSGTGNPPNYTQSQRVASESAQTLPQGSEQNPSRTSDDEILQEDLKLLEYLEMLESMELLQEMEFYEDMKIFFDEKQENRENAP